MLRDIAFVLHLTGKVKNQMMAASESNPSSLALAASDEGF
jgi:hypothetical protein